MTYFVYVLLNPLSEIYIGQTQDITKRISEHNNPECKSTLHTKRHTGPWKLIHSESFPTRANAMAREKSLKSGQGRQWIREVITPAIQKYGC